MDMRTVIESNAIAIRLESRGVRGSYSRVAVSLVVICDCSSFVVNDCGAWLMAIVFE